MNQRTVSEESKNSGVPPAPSPDTDLALFATAPRDLVGLLERELVGLGAAHLRAGHAGVRFRGSLEVAYRICLWSRLAARILMPLKSFPAPTADALYAGVGAIRWSAHLGPEDTLAVDFVSSRSRLGHSRYGAQRVKDAIVDQLRDATGRRPSVDRERPSLRVNAHLDRDVATIAVDLAGTGLHRRGYRRAGGPAPLKENVAAALLLLGGWPELAAAGAPLLDPMCGGGTLLVEGALMAADAAPGLTRDYFGLLGWRGHDPALWDRLTREARERRDAGLARLPPVAGFDADPDAVARARAHLTAAGLGDERIPVSVLDVADLAPPWPGATGLVACNPPWGERMGRPEAAADGYRALGEALRRRFPGWRVELISPAPTLASYLGLRPGRSHRLDNGPIHCRATRFEIPAAGAARAPAGGGDAGEDPGAGMFMNRLRKNLRQTGGWARREGIDCYRLYDADMPEYAFAIDVYRAADTWAVAQEYEAPASIPAERAAARRDTVLAAVATLLAIPTDRVIAKTRRRQQDGSQYERVAGDDAFHEVREDGCRLLVNLGDRLDTGLYLDHRPVRAMIRKLARGARFLNLFAYTGAATVHAAAGGARATTSVDLSRVYLDWARRNLALNGFGEDAHTLVRADCVEWLADAAGEPYDVVLLDAPTFSNSSAMSGTLDVQRDHPALLRDAARLLAPDGVLIFSNHLRRFRLDESGVRAAGLVAEDITRQTIPRDFARSPRIHHCWRMRRAC